MGAGQRRPLSETGTWPGTSSASAGNDSIAWYENAGGLGGFGPQQILTTSAATAMCVHAADLDLDGDADVLSASWNDNKIAWYENLQAPLMADVQILSLAVGGIQQLALKAGVGRGLELYLLLGTLGGTSPGLHVDGLFLPLNLDRYFVHTLLHYTPPSRARWECWTCRARPARL